MKSPESILLGIARIFLVVAGVLGLVYLGFVAVFLQDLFVNPKSYGPAIVGISVLPAAFGFYLLYGYISLSLSRKFKGSANFIWISTFIFNLLGVFTIPFFSSPKNLLFYAQFWPVLATILAGVALSQLMRTAAKAYPDYPKENS